MKNQRTHSPWTMKFVTEIRQETTLCDPTHDDDPSREDGRQ